MAKRTALGGSGGRDKQQGMSKKGWRGAGGKHGEGT